MRWVLHFFEWEALRWDDRGKECAIKPVEDREGCIAYAACRASLRRAISQALSASWADTLAFVAKITHPLHDSHVDMKVD
jgi:hypothetical protein